METTATTQKRMDNFVVVENQPHGRSYSLLKLDCPANSALADIKPGQFVQVKTPDNATFLRRPISVCNVDIEKEQLWLLVRNAGNGTAAINSVKTGETLNLVYPLGHGFTTSDNRIAPLLIGGGVGVAPLLFLARQLKNVGVSPTILLGARSANDVLMADEFRKYGDVYISTEDGSDGERGLVTTNSILQKSFDRIYCCGPMPMMKAIASIARKRLIDCEVSLENVMGCGVGACLCCVEKTKDDGNVCVCTEGPVFNINKLSWQD